MIKKNYSTNKTQTQAKKRKKLPILLLTIAIIISIFGYGVHAYISDYYRANQTAHNALKSTANVTVSYLDDNTIVFTPNDINAGLIFYPGGKVEYTAYAPLMMTFAENGYLCILPEMPCNLAVLAPNAADKYLDEYVYDSNYDWYLGGHSLGGAMASNYISSDDASNTFNGLYLMGAYAASDLSDTNLDVYLIHGSNDNVLNMENYNKNIDNLPDNYHEYIIDGGCHAYFGSYGYQDGDGDPTITNLEQIESTVDYIISTSK